MANTSNLVSGSLVAVCGVGLRLSEHDTTKYRDNADATQRRLIHAIYEAFEDGAEIRYRGREANVGLYLGTTNMDDDEGIDIASIASRVSRQYDLKGPRSAATGRSAPYRRLHEACTGIRKGEIEAAIVAQVVAGGKENDEENVFAVYIQAYQTAVARKSPIQAMLRVAKSAEATVVEDIDVINAADLSLVAVVQAVRWLNNRPQHSDSKTFISRSNCTYRSNL